MTSTVRSLVVVAFAALAARASAHEVDCTKLASVAVSDPAGGGPLLDPAGLPSLAAPLATSLTVDAYPALVAFDVTIRNLATDVSVLSSVLDTLPSDATRIRSFGDVLAGSIPVGGALHRVTTVAVASYADCLAAFPVDAVRDAPVCGRARDDVVTVTTETDIAVCRARVVCAPPRVPPPPPPPPPPGTCSAPTWTPTVQLTQPASVTNGHSVAVGCDGFTWASATSQLLPSSPEPLGALFRFDPAGVLTGTLRGADQLAALAADSAGGVVAIVAGGAGTQVGTFPPAAPLSVRRYDAGLAALWDSPLPGTPPDLGASLVVDAASSALVAYLRPDAQQQPHVAVRKLSPSGALLWDVDLAQTTAARLFLAGDGGAFVAGRVTDTSTPPRFDAPAAVVLARLDAGGTLLWTRQLPLPARTTLSVVTVDAAGRVAAAGLTDAPIDGGAPLASPQAFVASWDASGALGWVHVLRPTPFSGLPPVAAGTSTSHAVIDAAGAVWVAGEIDLGTLDAAQPAVSSGQPYVARFDTSGAMLWVRQFPLGDLGGAVPLDLRIDGAGSGVAMIFIHASLSVQWTWLERIAPDGT